MADPVDRRPGKIEVRSYFPTPLAVYETPGAETLNQTLKTVILERERATQGVEHSNLGGWQSDDDFERWSGAAGRRLLDEAVKLADRLTVDRKGAPVKIEWRMNSWANINRRGHANEFHTHPGCYWSGSYYVDDGGTAANPALGGEFEITDPRGVGPAMYAPNLSFALPGCHSMGANELIHPHAGMLLLFPSWLPHAVRPYLGEGLRISVAFNLSL